jgi:hypothetical protein
LLAGRIFPTLIGCRGEGMGHRLGSQTSLRSQKYQFEPKMKKKSLFDKKLFFGGLAKLKQLKQQK